MRGNGPKREITGTVVKVLGHRRDDAGMSLAPFASRCVRAGEVHELITTTHDDPAPGAVVDEVGYLVFAEIGRAGVIDRGDEVWIGTKLLGRVLGFGTCHLPDHYDIVVHNARTITGEDVHLRPEQELRFRSY
ncbi:hypothetical protein DMC64_20440 [Amycolatopsis sp. WAC 04197]|uniref:DUF6917 domain-containing protein n=1 Tax=Amycolatopsis sp. WAC 04197 TaxID=2203199 RepID=UPI000F787E3F|nr:hypothetical protein [Amycolatopsis sp. WAC 04197]RSN45207.1 hypothetical protein DMC64_20440 [Amycolatopsis sp. WAC 04197]